MNAMTYSGWSLQVEDIFTGTDYWNPSATIRYIWGADLSGTLDGAGGVPTMHNAQCIMHNSPESDEGQPRPHSLCIVHYELCIDGPARPDSFCILHSAFCIDAGLYYYGYRYYSPELGRWLTRDPIEEDGGDNLYAFCGNNGVKRYDYLGHVSRGTVDAIKTKKGVCYIFTIKVDTVGYNYSSGEAYFKSMAKRASKDAEGVGHTWVRLEDVRNGIVSEGGHSGENGDPKKNEKITNSYFYSYAKGVAYLAFMPPTAPSPMKDIPEADPYVQLNIPSSTTIEGKNIRLWSDPKYSSIRFALPEKMKQELKMWKGSGNYVYR